MGAYLDAPNTEKFSEHDKNEMCAWGAVGMQGWRVSMEDAHIAEKVKLPDGGDSMLFGVFDGHGGSEVATFVKEIFKNTFVDQQSFKNMDYKQALIDTFRAVDHQVSSKEYAQDTGSTSCVVFITPKKIFCANAGDSRAVLCRNKVAVPLSEDHKPQNADEESRINGAKHFVSDDRVDGNLALSRAFGDYQYKDDQTKAWTDQAVTANPDVTVTDRQSADTYIINACDGIWDCLTNQEACDMIGSLMTKANSGPNDYHKPVEQMLDQILAKDTETGIGTDNMTAILIKIHNQ